MRRSIVLAFLLLAIPARADDRDAGAHVKRALSLYQQHQFGDAQIEFEAAYAIEARPEILFAWAQAARLGGDCASAVLLYRRYLATNPTVRQQAAAEWSLTRCADVAAETQPASLEIVDAPAPPDTTVVPPPAPPPPRVEKKPDQLAITFIGVGGVGVAASLAFFLAAKVREADGEGASQATWLAAQRAADSWNTAALTSAAIGLGLAGIGGILYWRHEHAAPATKIGAWLAPGGGGLLATGTY